MKTESLKDFLVNVPLLSNLDDDELSQLSYLCSIKDYDKGQVIFYEFDKGTCFYIIVSGTVKISILSKDGREHILGTLKETDFFGELALIDGESRSTTIIAMEKVETICIGREDFINLLRNNPDITYKIMLHLCERIRCTDRHTGNLAFLSATGRIANTILSLAKKEGVDTEGVTVIHHVMTRQEFANFSGTSRETLTRVLIEFKEEGLINTKKNQIIVLDYVGLKKKVV